MKSRLFRGSHFSPMLLVISLALGSVTAYGYHDTLTVIVNGVRLRPETISLLENRLGLRMNSGNYWYDRVSGFWGYQGQPGMGQIPPGLNLGGPLREDASGGNTAVFINGREIHIRELMYLQQLFGFVQRGRYWLNAQGIGGYEGGPAMFNLKVRRGGGGRDYQRTTPFGNLGGDGDCFYYLHPGGASVSNCD